jgi:Uncharacterized protein family UPF0016
MKNVYLVTIGTIVGHGMCTVLAVLGGRYVSTKISVKHGACVAVLSFIRLLMEFPCSYNDGLYPFPDIRAHIHVRILCEHPTVFP